MKDSILQKKSFSFGVRIVKLFQFLKSEKKEYDMSRQILRCGTAIGALIKEAVYYAQSRADFVNKMSVDLKEASEIEYWLALLKETGYMDTKQYNSLYKDCNELLSMLIATVKPTKASLSE